ncbi:MAG: sigma 54-interacting transcriptional regulator [Planctomycetia bacterium]|nr:sigma 54-interacting transcriptional regulator [Planctomycetia bacterium]
MSNSAYLVFQNPSQWNEVFRLTAGKVTTIGRAPTNLVVIRDDRCSRSHAEVFYSETDHAWMLRDLQSRNGTLVNGKKVSSDADTPLYAGDLIRIGKTELMFLRDLKEIASANEENGEVLPSVDDRQSDSFYGSSNVLLSGSNPSAAEETMITCRREKARLLDTERMDHADFQSPSRKGRMSVANLCLLAIEISRHGDKIAKLKLALENILKEVSLNHAAILLLPPDTLDASRLEVTVSRCTTQPPEEYQKVSDYLARTVLESKNAVIARHVRGDSILGRRNSAGVIDTTSVIVAPIYNKDRVWGLIHVYSTDPARVPHEQDLDYTLGVAEILAVSLENAEQQSILAESLTRARNENADLRKRLGVQSEIVGSSRTVVEITEQIALAANTRSTVLIRGESGVGKELVARAVHYSSPRRKNPFICLNCAALAEDLLASELFGHERGAFTGATDRKIGKFEAANGGSLMLDEIGEMSLNIQSKFLRVLEGHPFERVGGNKPISADVRVIAATNRDLEEEVRAGRFRKDLFFRLRVIEILVPPLRERATDIPELAEHFFQQFRNETGKRLTGFSNDAVQKLMLYSWPGNIRELKNVIERAVVFARGTEIVPEDLLLSNLAGEPPVPSLSESRFLPKTLEEIELDHIRQTLEFTEGNKSKAAALLGIERTTLDRKLKKIQV